MCLSASFISLFTEEWDCSCQIANQLTVMSLVFTSSSHTTFKKAGPLILNISADLDNSMSLAIMSTDLFFHFKYVCLQLINIIIKMLLPEHLSVYYSGEKNAK